MKNTLQIEKESGLGLESLFLLGSVILYVFIPPLNLIAGGWLTYRFKTREFTRVFQVQLAAILCHILLLGGVFFTKMYDAPKALSTALFFGNGVVYIANILLTYFILRKYFSRR